MVSREYIYTMVKSHYVIAVHMKGEERIDNLSSVIYVIRDIVLDEWEEKQLLQNIQKGINSEGVLRIKATLSSEVDVSMEDNIIKEYVINTKEIVLYELPNIPSNH